ncbi:MAGUK p55 subfamily member 6b isoform X1 [Pundamilia nyererei]|uniref:MAGUK p55 subfamily member 6-like n=2 Tax=Pundamilia nyererei TaxID=303518 RepID=A0A3B4GTQ8_9CICH|nr:PREDICTED: MAGUK p55 subfamily member 6-like isoform X1 [Pundamilia nyererei]XP_005728810.1 PREDICTED: MAGUK p55 subfamily member 6-like isoform X1 [Pundamilia nyererei]XP_013765217.1 PREDICTED: MAGUK p55 subfamily member 6-like isoform X1 [Pundamilia nyererei]
MVTAMEDSCPNGAQEEEEVRPLGQHAVEGPPAVRSTQGAETSGAMQQVLDNVGELPTSAGAKDIDLLFLRGIMESPIAQEQLEEVKLEAVQDNNVELVTEILGDINSLKVKDDSAAELSRILQEPHFQSLLEAHDMVASKCYEAPPPTETANDAAVNSALMQADAVRMIGIRKKAGEPLGVTFRVEKDDLVIARILHGGMIDRQGLLHVGDIIKEVNGKDVGNNPTELQEMLKDCSGGITLKILPSYRDAPAPPQVYVRPYFDYDPANDSLIPCREAGMAFKKGDILQIVNREDPNWWQACHVVGGATGLIPSQFLEEKRKAFVPRDLDGSGILCGTLAGKKKKKMMYLTAKNAEFDRHELQIYEEVAKVPAFQRKTLVLIGAQGVGRRSLKNRLMVLHPTRFGTTIPYTSRRPRDEELGGNSYHFTSRTEMEADVKAGRFLEHGEYDGNLYGTKIDSIHEVVAMGRTCILDVNPQALKVLKTAEFMPYVVFIGAPDFDTLKAMHKAVVDAGLTAKQLTDVDLRKTVDESARIQRAYCHYFDLTIINDNLDKAFETLQAAVDKLCSEPQWVPVNWVY